MTDIVPYEVQSYSPSRLLELLSNHSEASIEKIKTKMHADYFQRYFQAIRATTIIIEREYVDRDYLEDYAAYYARCFREYPRHCCRLHFFKNSFDESSFRSLLRNENGLMSINELKEGYLGFLVIRPLPSSVIGRTCLKTYSDDNGRCFPSLKWYSSNLFGIHFTLESLAFQEQDHAVAACATSALWTAFQKTGHLFQHSIPAPAEITRCANEQFPLESRGFPSEGLTLEQMAGAIRSVGLEPYVVRVSSTQLLRNVLYAYAEAGIPPLLIFTLYNTSEYDGSDPDTLIRRGKHAVTVTGYHLGDALAASGYLRNSRAMRMDKIYVHDDQVGPFARMGLDEQILQVDSKYTQISVEAAWLGAFRAVPEHVILPLYHKVRIPFESVSLFLEKFARLLNDLADNGTTIVNDLEWDIHLAQINDLRSKLLQEGILIGDALERARAF